MKADSARASGSEKGVAPASTDSSRQRASGDHSQPQLRLRSTPCALKRPASIFPSTSPSGFATARSLVRPRGTLVLKSTFHADVTLNLSQIVVDEVNIVGSRCGPFPAALRLLEEGLIDVEPLIQQTYPLQDGMLAFERAAAPGMLKVLLAA